MSVFSRITPIENPYPNDFTFEKPLSLGKAGGVSGRLNFIASDNDQANIAINTNDLLVFSGASGGYSYDEPLIIGSTDPESYKLKVYAPLTNNDVMFQSGGGNVSINLYAGLAGDVNWLLMSGYPSAGDFAIRESGVQTSLIINKTTGNATFGGSINTVLATYSDDATAGVGGLTAGQMYKTATGEVRIKL